MKKLILLSSTAVFLPSAAFAQSTGSVDFDETIVITGAAEQDIDGIEIPDTAKPKQIIGEEVLEDLSPGQTAFEAANIVPGVSYQANDAYGSGGGEIVMRGFTDNRVSVTFDGIPMNDSGNYEVYTTQSLDAEVLQQINVNLGATDIDSPTGSAIGGTLNMRVRDPNEEFGARFVQSIGENDFYRTFFMIDSGNITDSGTRAFAGLSRTAYDNPFQNFGKVDREQYHAKIYQPIGSFNDFISATATYTEVRNNFFGSVPLRYDRETPSGFPQEQDERDYLLDYPCTIPDGVGGVAERFPVSCGSEFERRINPVNYLNIRLASRWSLTDKLTLTVDPAYTYTKANGGGTRWGDEGLRDGLTGVFDDSPYFGYDLNGDGDTLDRVNVLIPSQTVTNRFAVISGLRFDVNDDHTVRLAYTYDRADHRQTGEAGLLDETGMPIYIFPVDDPLLDANGAVITKRDRQSYSILNQVSVEWRGDFDRLRVTGGLRVPFFKRDLENYCFAIAANGDVNCFGQDAALNAAFAAANPDIQGPDARVLNYSDVLPSIGATYDVTDNVSAFANYTRSFSVPSTDFLYAAFYYPEGEDAARPDPEYTDSFDIGARYKSRKVQAQLNGWFTKYSNRLATAYDPILDERIFRNLGQVDKYGIDANIAYAPIPQVTLYGFASIYESNIKDDTVTGTDAMGNPTFAPTAGKQEGGSPTTMFGGSVATELGPVEAGVTAKYHGGRFVFDTNEANDGIFPAKTPSYVNVDAHVRLRLDDLIEGTRDTFLQLNVVNLLDEVYVGSFGARLEPSNGQPFAQIGVPRTFSATVSMGF